MHMQVIITLIFLVTKAIGSSVNINVEDGFSLEGPQCPGTVTVSCTGLELVSLRWRYNGEMTIISYFSDGTPSTNVASFSTVRLLSVAQNPTNPNLANFSSSLTVDYLQLVSNNITDISCSSPATSRVLPVNVIIIQPGPPSSPVITMVTAAYQAGELNSVEIKWDKPKNTCPTTAYGLSLDYEVNITESISTRMNQSSCGDMLCVTSFKNFLRSSTGQYEISIIAENELGSSNVVAYPIILAHQIQQYFQFEVFVRNNQINGRCTATADLVGANECIIQYTNISTTSNLPDPITVPLDQEFSIDNNPGLLGATYYLQVSALANTTLLITDAVTYVFSPEPADVGFPAYGIALIILIFLVAVLIVIGIIIVLLCKIRGYRNKKLEEFEKDSKPEPQPEEKPKPPQCEICVQPYDYTEMKNGTATPKYPKYKITVSFQGENPVCIKRYTDFENLHKAVDPNEKTLGKFPSKTLEGKEKKIEDIQNQQKGLSSFLVSLLKIEGLIIDKAVQKFFDDDYQCYDLLLEAILEQHASLCEREVEVLFPEKEEINVALSAEPSNIMESLV